MEGSYLPGKQRAKLALQGRKSHFAFGRVDGGFATTQQTFYKSFVQTSTPQNNPKNRTTSHFTLGCESHYKSTESNANYRTHSIDVKKTRLKTNDLTPKDFVMGMQKMKFVTTNNTFTATLTDKFQSHSNSPSKNRKHNFDLGNDLPVKSSVMQADFSPMKPDPVDKVNRGMFNSHIVLGGHPSMYKSVASKEHSGRFEPPGSLDLKQLAELKKEHFTMGKDKPTVSTNQQNSYKPMRVDKQGLDKAQLENLKSSHFSFNAEMPDYISLSQMSMKYAKTEIPSQESYLKTNHIVFGDDKQNFGTNYGKNHVFRSQSVIEPHLTKNNELSHDVVLGVTNSAFASTSHSWLNGEAAKPGRLDPALEKNLRGHHYSLGNSTNIYEQSHKNYGTGPCKPAEFNAALNADMTATHWVSGFHKEPFSSYTTRTYKPKNAEKRNVEDYLRKHNHKLGESADTWGSSYNGRFKWIQPVPDTSAKFSFD